MEATLHQPPQTLKEFEEQTLGGLDMVVHQLDRALEALSFGP